MLLDSIAQSLEKAKIVSIYLALFWETTEDVDGIVYTLSHPEHPFHIPRCSEIIVGE